MTCINMGRELGEFKPSTRIRFSQADGSTLTDMGLVNDLVELIHGPQKEIGEMFL